MFNLEYPQSVGVYESYAEAQRAVDVLADQAFPRTLAIRDAILDVQYGRSEDRHGWMHQVVPERVTA